MGLMSPSSEPHRHFLPAAGSDLFLPLYDPINRLVGTDRARRALIDQARLAPGQRVLDVGCGTGTLAVQMVRAFPGIALTGLDPDPKALARARRKAEGAGVTIRWDQGFADGLPYPDASFDRVFSSMMFHHLQTGDKEKMLREVHRVLSPQGTFHLMDAAGREGSPGLLERLLHAHARLKDNSEGRILEWMRRAGLREPAKVAGGRILFVRVAYFAAGR